MTDTVARLREAGTLSALDAELSRALSALAPETSPETALAIALASRATREGHVCADLGALAGAPLLSPDGEPLGARYPELAAWRAALSTSSLVGTGTGTTPLVLDSKGRLYLRRYWEDEARLALALSALAGSHVEPRDPAGTAALVRRLFPDAEERPNRQRLAAQIACLSRFTLISGGPGTGKTTTVAGILALLLADALAGGDPHPRALLLAPTGKAAARLAEAVGRAKAGLDCPDAVRRLIPEEARTIHRALGAGRTGFRIHAERPLFADVVVVDEASMVDLSLMRRVVEAVPRKGRLVLLGDRHQLSSVEAGAVLSDIAGDTDGRRYSPDQARRISDVFGDALPASFISGRTPVIEDSVAELVTSHRFAESGALGRLARGIQRGDAAAVLSSVRESNNDVTFIEPRGAALSPSLAQLVVEGFRPLCGARDAAFTLEHLSAFRVLCAHREGPLGVHALNRWTEQRLTEAKLLGPGGGLLYPVLVEKNDPDRGLYNGDVGVVFRDPTGSVRAVFAGEAGRGKALSPARLPPHSPAFAMSVHKSQGSEFDTVAVVLPAPGSPLLTRELLYTAVTRARRRVILHGVEAALVEAVNRRVARASGLGEALRIDRPE